MIPKVAHDAAPYARRFVGFPDARSAFREILAATDAARLGGVLLPAYVGWSPREGSGVFDPVQALDVPATFYRVDERLHIDLDHVASLLERRPRVLLLIHYFGFPDPAFHAIVELAHAKGVVVIEDEAHALLTDLVAGSCGRAGDACLVSLHKVLPLASGGGLIVNPRGEHVCSGIRSTEPSTLPYVYDLATFANIRRRNALLICELLAPLAGRIDPLWELGPYVVPQTFPVIVRSYSRDKLYEQMNDAGFGVVSLYHTLVDALSAADFPASAALARSIMNLPVHQDASEDQLRAMVAALDRFTR